MKRTKLVVYNKYCLGYILPECPNMVCTLADSVLKGAPFRVMNEPYQITKSDKIRLASEKDFEDFRVSFEGYDNRELYEYL